MADLIQLRRDTLTKWQTVDPVLGLGEVGLIISAGGQMTNPLQFKVGTGIHRWSELPIQKTADPGTLTSLLDGEGPCSVVQKAVNTNASNSASNTGAIALGYSSSAAGRYSMSEGRTTETRNDWEHAMGNSNISHSGSISTRFSVGVGTGSTNRKNAVEVTTDGKVYVAGVGTYQGTSANGNSGEPLSNASGSDLATVIGGKIDKIINITYSELKSLRDNSQLVPGQSYRITDFVTATPDWNYTPENNDDPDKWISAGHRFDLIVIAKTPSELFEDARVIRNANDGGYFQHCDLAKWEIKYSLDNNFTWSNTSSGKGTIYYMKDEFQNEAWFDFKNLMYRRYAGDVEGQDMTWDDGKYLFCSYYYDDFDDRYYAEDLSVAGNTYTSDRAINNSVSPCFQYGYETEEHNLYLPKLTFEINSNQDYNIENNKVNFLDELSLDFATDTDNGTTINNVIVGSNNTISTNPVYGNVKIDGNNNTILNGRDINLKAYLYTGCNNNNITNCSYIHMLSGTNITINACDYIYFGSSSSSLKSFYSNITIEPGNRFIYLSCTGTTATNSNYKNITIKSGVNKSTPFKTISDSNVNQNYHTTYQPVGSQTISV